ncbi:hypothetical protein GCM10020295_62730 [Streptomyces cinereospinus]
MTGVEFVHDRREVLVVCGQPDRVADGLGQPRVRGTTDRPVRRQVWTSAVPVAAVAMAAAVNIAA